MKLLLFGLLPLVGSHRPDQGMASGWCLTENRACTKEASQNIGIFHPVHNQLGCKERCLENGKCDWWTYYGPSDPERPETCELFTACGLDDAMCKYCWTGERDCLSNEVEENILLIGGCDSAQDCAAEFEVLGPDGPCQYDDLLGLDDCRTGSTASTVGLQIFACGGERANVLSKTCFEYNMNLRNWTTEGLTPMTSGRASASSVSAYGELYVIGGYSQAGEVLSSVEVFNPECGAWRSGPELPDPRAHHCSVRFRDAIYVIGGLNAYDVPVDTVLKFNVTDGKWSEMEPLPTVRYRHACAVDRLSVSIVAAGGVDEQGEYSDRVDHFSLATRSWKEAATKLNEPRASHSVAVTLENGPTVFGGINENGMLDSVELLDGSQWVYANFSLRSARYDFAAALMPVDMMPPCKPAVK